jgi:hypothetical protein
MFKRVEEKRRKLKLTDNFATGEKIKIFIERLRKNCKENSR